MQAWEKCVDTNRESGADFVDACTDVTRQLKECMEANADYYSVLLEGAPEDEVQPQAEGEREPKAAEAAAAAPLDTPKAETS